MANLKSRHVRQIQHYVLCTCGEAEGDCVCADIAVDWYSFRFARSHPLVEHDKKPHGAILQRRKKKTGRRVPRFNGRIALNQLDVTD